MVPSYFTELTLVMDKSLAITFLNSHQSINKLFSLVQYNCIKIWKTRDWGCSSVRKHLPSMGKALVPCPAPQRKKKTGKSVDKYNWKKPDYKYF